MQLLHTRVLVLLCVKCPGLKQSELIQRVHFTHSHGVPCAFFISTHCIQCLSGDDLTFQSKLFWEKCYLRARGRVFEELVLQSSQRLLQFVQQLQLVASDQRISRDTRGEWRLWYIVHPTVAVK